MGSITGFTLINAATDQELRPLANGDTIVLAVDGNSLTIRADVSIGPGERIGSVRFDLDVDGTLKTNFKTEEWEPFAMNGDSQTVVGDYYEVDQLKTVGSYEVFATPFAGDAKSGMEGTTVSLEFKIVSS